MTVFGSLGLSLAITPLRNVGTSHFAVHVLDAPFTGSGDLHDCLWTNTQCQLWQAWQEMFSSQAPLPPYPTIETPLPEMVTDSTQPGGLGVRLMQNLGINLWQWLFDGPILTTLNRSQGIAIGQGKPLRIRLEIRDPSLIALPWEIMQDSAGRQAVSLSQNLLFSRTTSDVNALPPLRADYSLRILLVLGQPNHPTSGAQASTDSLQTLKLEQEAATLAQVLRTSGNSGIGGSKGIPCQVDVLVQPTPIELIQAFETRLYNVFFYAGHGMPGPDGGMLFLRPDMTLNGTELAQVLTRCQVKLAVFNACWGAQADHYPSDRDSEAMPGVKLSQPIPRSSLAEVLIHHGVPAVLGMRDVIADQEALSFIETFAKALAERMPIDQAVAVARQHLLTVYKFNQQAWTLPVFYMHPEFDGELLKTPENSETGFGPPEMLTQIACMRSLKDGRVWQIRGGLMRIGRSIENDLVLKEDETGVSREHAMILRRDSQDAIDEATYFLKDFSRFGTWVLVQPGWQKVHHQEISIPPGTQMKFGSSQNEALEFVIFSPTELSSSG
jgi:CHAT domain/FHA domain